MLEAFAADVEIPLKYGVDQCVGDTLCIGGIMYRQRGAAILDFCRDIREVVAPGCILLNYSYHPVKGFTLKEKTVEEIAAEKEKFTSKTECCN